MAIDSILTTSRETGHKLISQLFTSTFGDQANLDKTSLNAWLVEVLTDIERSLAVSMTLENEEKYLNTCKKISTARMIGYNYGFDSRNVSPATGNISFTLMLPLNFKSQSIYIKADETFIVANNIKYMFPGDIEVVADSRGFIQTVRRTNHIFNTSDNDILYSESKIVSDSSTLVYAFSSEVMQVDFTDSSFIISDHMQMTNSENEISFEDNFYKIEIWYETYDNVTNSIVKTTLLEVNDLNDYNGFTECFKTELIDSNKIKIITGNLI